MTFDVNKDLEFRMVGQKPKTQVFEVWNKQQNFMIGIIKWHPSWRHYCFFPANECVFSDRCLIKIGEFTLDLNLKKELKE